MAGIKQHVLPQFLLAGFASRLDRDKPLVWVHRRGGKIFETGISGFGFEKHFYGGEKEEINADPFITTLEGPYSGLVKALRETPDGTLIEDSRVPEVVGHISSRTKHLRESFTEASTEVVRRAAEHFGENATMHDFLRQYYTKHPEKLREALDEVLLTMSLSRPQRRMLRKQVLAMGRNKLVEYVIQANPTLGAEAFEIFSAVQPVIPDATRKSHIKTLAKDLSESERVQAYREMNWYVVVPSTPVVLGDVACVYATQSRPEFLSYAAKEDGITGIFLPISPQIVIVGNNKPNPPSIDGDAFNLGMVRLSREYFVADRTNEYTKSLLAQLGLDSKLLSDDEITDIIHSDLAE